MAVSCLFVGVQLTFEHRFVVPFLLSSPLFNLSPSREDEKRRNNEAVLIVPYRLSYICAVPPVRSLERSLPSTLCLIMSFSRAHHSLSILLCQCITDS